MKHTEKHIRTRVEEEIHRINKTLKREIAVKITEEVIKAALIEAKVFEIDEAGDALPIKQKPWDVLNASLTVKHNRELVRCPSCRSGKVMKFQADQGQSCQTCVIQK